MDLQGPRFSSCPFRTRENSWEFRWSIWCTIYRGDADTARRSARIFRHFKRYSFISLSFLRLYKRTLRIDWWRILEIFLFNYSNNSHNSSEWIEIHWKIKIYFSVGIHIRWNNFRLFDSRETSLNKIENVAHPWNSGPYKIVFNAYALVHMVPVPRTR